MFTTTTNTQKGLIGEGEAQRMLDATGRWQLYRATGIYNHVDFIARSMRGDDDRPLDVKYTDGPNFIISAKSLDRHRRHPLGAYLIFIHADGDVKASHSGWLDPLTLSYRDGSRTSGSGDPFYIIGRRHPALYELEQIW